MHQMELSTSPVQRRDHIAAGLRLVDNGVGASPCTPVYMYTTATVTLVTDARKSMHIRACGKRGKPIMHVARDTLVELSLLVLGQPLVYCCMCPASPHCHLPAAIQIRDEQCACNQA